MSASTSTPSRYTATDSQWTDFVSPPNGFRGKPFWSWNAQLDATELKRQIEVFRCMGMGGYFMHARTGLRTPYLGPEWLNLINSCSDAGNSVGLESWLYDEDRWPSGSAGGMATTDPSHRLNYLRMSEVTADNLADALAGEGLVAAFSVRIDGLALHGFRRLDVRNARPRAIRDGETAVVFRREVMPPHSFFNGGSYLNTLDRRATENFMATTHERYLAACDGRIGSAIKGIFTDEPHRGFVMCDRIDQGGPGDSATITPWTPDMGARFRRRFGYDLIGRLPELFFKRRDQPVSRVKWHYMELLQSLFLDNWARPIHRWCRRHGLKLTGHALHEDSLVAQAVPCGSMLRYYEHMDVPGVDVLANDNRNYWIVKQVTSVARQQGKRQCLSELYGCTGWQLDFAGHKEIGDWQAILGINVRCHHLSWYSMAGEAKRDYPASIFFQSAWHREYRYVEDYFSRLHVALGRGEAVCDILVIHPVETVWAKAHAGWATWLGPKSPDVAPVESAFRNLCLWLLEARLDFDYGDEDHLARFGKVAGRDDDARLQLGRSRYKAVVVAGLETMRGTTLSLLRRFAGSGGKVLFAGPVPSHVDAVPSAKPRALGRSVLNVPLKREPLVRALRALAPPLVRLADHNGDGGQLRSVMLQIRREGDTVVVAIANTDPKHPRKDIRITASIPTASVEEWDARTGSRFAVAVQRSGTNTSWVSSMAALGERIFVISQRPTPGIVARPLKRVVRRHKARGPYSFELDEPNLLVLDTPEWCVGDGQWRTATDILAVDSEIRNRLGLEQRNGIMVQPWARSGRTPADARTRLSLRYRVDVREIPSSGLRLMIEQPDRWRVTFNGTRVRTADSDEWLIDPCFKIAAIPGDAVRRGENVLVLEADFDADLDLEACYLLGSFGVYFDGDLPWIGGLPEKLEAGDVVRQGLPFYSGRIRYFIQPPPPPSSAARCDLKLARFGGAVATVKSTASAAQQPGFIAFPPHECEIPAGKGRIECEIVLTRRNTFGPLHLVPKRQSSITPEHFRSTGRAYRRACQFEPAGLLGDPQFIYWVAAG